MILKICLLILNLLFFHITSSLLNACCMPTPSDHCLLTPWMPFFDTLTHWLLLLPLCQSDWRLPCPLLSRRDGPKHAISPRDTWIQTQRGRPYGPLRLAANQLFPEAGHALLVRQGDPSHSLRLPGPGRRGRSCGRGSRRWVGRWCGWCPWHHAHLGHSPKRIWIQRLNDNIVIFLLNHIHSYNCTWLYQRYPS